MIESFQGGAGAKIGAADADYDDEVDAAAFPIVAHGLASLDKGFGRAVGELLPAEEIIACAGLLVEHVVCGKSFVDVFAVEGILYERIATVKINLYHRIYCFFLYSLSPSRSRTSSGSLVVMASTPISIIRRMSSSLLTVQALTDIPLSWADLTQSGWALNIL